MKKTIKWILILSLIGGGAYGVYYVKAKKKADSTPTFDRALVEIRDLRTTVESTGEIKPRNRLDVKPPIAGRLEELPVDEGDEVEKGQIIGWISSTERATLLDAALATSEAEMEYWQKLYKPSPLISPLKGTIIARNFEPGQSINASDAVVVIADDLIVVASLDETDIGMVKLSQKVNVRLEAYPDRAFDCNVEKIAYDARTESAVTMYDVDVAPKNLPAVARSGMTANLEFVIQEKEGVLAIPTAAVQSSGQSKSGPKGGGRRSGGGKMAGEKMADGKNGPKSYVLVDSGDPENPAQKPVVIGISDGAYTEIIEGLAEGDEVLIRKIRISSDNPGASSPFTTSMGRRVR